MFPVGGNLYPHAVRLTGVGRIIMRMTILFVVLIFGCAMPGTVQAAILYGPILIRIVMRTSTSRLAKVGSARVRRSIARRAFGHGSQCRRKCLSRQ